MTLFFDSTILVLIFLTVFHNSSTQDCVKKGILSQEKILREHTLCNYNKNVRPITDKNKPIDVTLQMVLKSFDFENFDQGKLNLREWIAFMWNDTFLTWDPQFFNNLKVMHLIADQIWVPKLKENKGDGSNLILPISECLVTNTGNVVTTVDTQHDVICNRDVTYWPYDTQTCSFSSLSSVYSTSEVNFILTEQSIILTSFAPHPEWKLKKIIVTPTKYKSLDQMYQILQLSVTIERHSTKITALLLVPAVALIVTTLASLRLKPGSTERLCLVTVNILNNFFYIQHLGNFAPMNGRTLPVAVTFFRDSLGIAAALLIESTLINSLLSDRIAPPSWMLTSCKFIANDVFRRGLLIEEAQEAEIKDEESVIEIDDSKQQQANKRKKDEKLFLISMIDILTFVVFLLTYIILLISKLP